MNICLVSQEYPPETAHGGIGTQTWNKARMLSRLGHSIHVIAASGRDQIDTRIENHDGVTVHRVGKPGIEFPVYREPTYWLGYSWAVFREIRLIMREIDFDVVDFAEYGAEGFVFMLDRNPYNYAPAVVQLHGPLSMFVEKIGWPERDSDFQQIGTMMEDYCIHHADALMACSANIADFTAGYHGVNRDSIAVVHCGVDADRFQCGCRQAERPTVLFIGNIVNNKGVDIILNAVVKLRGKYPNILMQILGKGDENYIAQLKEKAAGFRALENVEFYGFVGREKIADFYQRAWVFASPAQHEPGTANVYLEAMASGCPVLAANTGGAPEAVQDGVSGLLVPPDDSEATFIALDCILADAKLRHRMGQAGRQRVEDYFAMDKYIGRVLAVYERAIEIARCKRSCLL